MSRSMIRDELVEFAIFLYGPKWQTPLATELGVERRALVRDLAAEKPIGKQSAEIILFLVDEKIERMRRENDALRARVERLKREIALDFKPRAPRSGNREIAS